MRTRVNAMVAAAIFAPLGASAQPPVPVPATATAPVAPAALAQAEIGSAVTQSSPVDSPAERAAASYSLGVSFATQWREGGLEGLLSVDDLVRGIRAGLDGSPLTPQDRERASAFMSEAFQAWASRNDLAAQDFLAQNAKAPGVHTTASGLEYEVLKKGEAGAPAPQPYDRITVQYRGRLLNGYEFDSTYSRGKAAVVRPNDVIAGWREALAMMSKGAQWRLYVPPALAYAKRPPPSIPPNSLLIFDVELLGVEPGAAPRASAPARGAVAAAAPASAAAKP